MFFLLPGPHNIEATMRMNISIPCIILVASALYVLYKTGILDAEIEAHDRFDRSGISIYLRTPFSTAHLLFGFFVWSCFAFFIYRQKIFAAVHRITVRLKCIHSLYFLICVIGLYQTWQRSPGRSTYPFKFKLPTPNVQVLIFDASVGRLANLMINFLWLSIRAQRTGMEIRVIKDSPSGVLSRFPNVHYTPWEFGGLLDLLFNVTVSDHACGDFFQNYLYFQRHRPLAAHLFDLPGSLLAALPTLGPDDIVIHFRVLELHYFPHTDPDLYYPPYAFFAGILDTDEAAAPAPAPARTIWIVTEPAQRAHVVVRQLVKARGARVVGASAEAELWLAARAPVLVGSQGTFSWIAAYLFQGRRAHLPFVGSEPSGSIWTPQCALFIHDDPRLRYHDIRAPAAGGRTAAQLVAGAAGPEGSAFARCAAARAAESRCMP
jgi:hypothetical protein